MFDISEQSTYGLGAGAGKEGSSGRAGGGDGMYDVVEYDGDAWGAGYEGSCGMYEFATD